MPNKENENKNNGINNVSEGKNDVSPQLPRDEAPSDMPKNIIQQKEEESTMQGNIPTKGLDEDTPKALDDEKHDDLDMDAKDIPEEMDMPIGKIDKQAEHPRPIPPQNRSTNGGGRKPPNKAVLRILIICLVILGSLAGLYLYGFLQNEKYLAAIDIDTFYNGIFIDNIHLGGMTKQQAMEQISMQQKLGEKDIKVTVVWDDTEQYEFTADDVEVTYDTIAILDEAYNVARSGSNKERYNQVMDLSVNNMRFSTSRTVDAALIEAEVRQIAASKAADVSEPAVEFNPDPSIPREDWFIYSDPIPGIQTDDEALWQSVNRAFSDQTFGTIPVPKWEILPDEDIDFREITQQIVSFKTVQARNSNREHNIALACSMISGTILMPGEEFSMNDTTGERTKAKGFKEANTILGGNELVPGIAGGVCQVSGTLFNAALMADLEITERYHHSFELGYLSRGRDATVNYGSIDLKFVNNKEYPIYIAMFTDGLDVYAEIYGAPLVDCDHITIWVKTTKTVPIGDPVYVKDSTVPAGAEPKYLKGHQGITCQVYKIYKDAEGKQIASEHAYTDVYKYYAPEIHVNPVDYDGYINPTAEPSPTPDSTPANAETETPEPDSTPVNGDGDGDGSVG